MKKSEFIKQVKQEIAESFEKLRKFESNNVDNELMVLTEQLLKDGMLFEMMANDEDGRQQICVILETLKVLSEEIEKIEQKEPGRATSVGLTFEENNRIAQEGAARAIVRSIELEQDFVDDMNTSISEEDMLASLLGSLGNKGNTKEEVFADFFEKVSDQIVEGMDDDIDNLTEQDLNKALMNALFETTDLSEEAKKELKRQLEISQSVNQANNTDLLDFLDDIEDDDERNI